MHICMMHISNIIDPHACVFDVCMMPISMMRLKFCLGRTNKAILGVGLIFSQQRKLFVFSVTEHIKIPRGPFNGGSAH